MSFNPFIEEGIKPCETFRNWEDMSPMSYDKVTTDPYTKTRIILANGTEFEGAWFKHQLLRQCNNEEIRREISLTRRLEQEQQKELAVLKPTNESMIEHAIAYEQLAIDLTAMLAKREKDVNVKKALDFALLEDFDHLYRFANLLAMENGEKAEELVRRFTEIMPGRPTISEHRFPYDDVKEFTDFKCADILTKLQTMIITAAEQQTMNFYMNAATLYDGEMGRKLFQEIGLIEEQHVTQYGSLLDPNCTWLEEALMHEYVECYLYYSFTLEETDERIKKIWERNLKEEIGHLHAVAKLLEKYENRTWKDVLKTDGTFPEPLCLGSNKEYIRRVLVETVENTSCLYDYIEAEKLSKNHRFFFLQKKRNGNLETVPTHMVIRDYIDRNGTDYRYEDAPHPVEELRDRTCDNVILGRDPGFDSREEGIEFFTKDDVPASCACAKDE